jgi:AraC-like DNA-binding protein
MKKTPHPQEWFHEDGFPLAIERRCPHVLLCPQTQEFAKIVVVIGGYGKHVVGKDSWSLSAGDVFVIQGSESHEYADPDHLSLINILYRPEQLMFEAGDLETLPGYQALFVGEASTRHRQPFQSRVHLSPGYLGHLLAMIDHLDSELAHRNPGFGFCSTAILMQIVGYLVRAYGQREHPDSKALERIARTIAHLETRYAEPIHLDDLATMAHMSRRAYMRTFQAATGQSPINYLIQTRIRRAADLLRQREETITKIALETGFDDSNYFTRQFRKVMGQTPRAYRQQYARGES